MRKHLLFAVSLVWTLVVGTGYAQDRWERGWDPETALRAIQRAIEEKGAHWTAGMTEIFMLPPELQRQMCGCTDSITERRIPGLQQMIRSPWLPEKFDWRNKDGEDWMTGVRNQGRCGSCVAFATIGTLEGQINIYNNNPTLNLDLSEQHIFFCGGGTCDEGWGMSDGFRYLLENGAPEEACFPYTAGEDGKDQPCSNTCPDWRQRVFKITCWGYVGGDDDVKTPAEIKDQLLRGPVATAMMVYEDFDAYTGGIYEHVYGEQRGGHAIVLVGWDDTTTPPCWIVKNSWGPRWGERGYFRIRMGTNEVGIESRSLYLALGDVPEGELSDHGHLYGRVEVGNRKDWKLKISNVGRADLEIYGFSEDIPGFYVSAPTTYPQTIAPNGTLNVTVTFAPDTVGFQYKRMKVLSNSCRLLPDLKLRGTGVVHNLKATPKSIEETMAEGELKRVPITLTYTGDTALTFHVTVLREWLSVEPDSGTMEPGGSTVLEVTFDTSSLVPGEQRTNILIDTDDPTDNVVVVSVLLHIEAAGVTLTIPASVTPIDRTVDLELVIDNQTRVQAPITDVSIQLGFDTTLLELQAISPTPRTELMNTFLWSVSEPGELILSISDTRGNTIAPGTGAVAEISFEVQAGASCGDSARLIMADVTLTDTTGTSLDVGVKDGLIVFLCKGDVDASGSVEIADVLQAVQFILAKTCHDGWGPECWAADYNDDGTIEAMDLVGMINILLGPGGGWR
ncbi:MAG: C1 family peptidase [bacterium]